MNGRQRSPVPGLFVWLLFLAAAVVVSPPGLFAQPYPFPGAPVPGAPPYAPEPPLAGPPPGMAGPPGYGPPQATEPVDPPTPVVSIKVRVPAQVTPGQDLEYRILVENVSRAAAYHVQVRNPLPPNATYVKATPEPTKTDPEPQWYFKELAPGARQEIVLVLKPDGTGDVINAPRVRFEHGQSVTTRISRPTLAIRKTGPAQAVLYDQVNFRLEITNSGRARATDVVVTDTLPEGLEFFESKPPTDGPNPLVWKIDRLEAGETRRIDYSVTVKRAGRLTGKAAVESGGKLRQETTSTLFVGTPKLALTKTGPERRLVKRPVAYLLTVSNPGDLPANNVEISDEIPEGIDFLSASAGGRFVRRASRGSAALDQVRWSLGTLPAGASRTVQVVIRAAVPGEFVNVAAATADRGLTAKANVRTRFEEGTGLSAEIDKGADPVEVGREVSYQVRVLNPGKAPAQAVSLIVTAPEELRVSNARGPMGAEQNLQTVKFAALPALRPGAEAVYTVYAQALKPGAAKLRVEVTSAETGPSPLTWEETVTVRAGAEAGPAPPARR
jgi:uncharacterized repeat protein (TIGR01451 family)